MSGEHWGIAHSGDRLKLTEFRRGNCIQAFAVVMPNMISQVQIVPYNPDWPDQFALERDRLIAVLGTRAIAVEHVGSTSIPALAAKDIIDVQVSVNDLSDPIVADMSAKGYRVRSDYCDVFDGIEPGSLELKKLFATEPKGFRRTHIHIRQVGRFNHRYALLFRDYLRANPAVSRQYEQLKRAAALAYPDDIDGYLALKDPVFNLLYRLAENWASSVGWDVGVYTKMA